MSAERAAPVTTRFTKRITTIADVEALERSPYDAVVPARNLYQLFEATAGLHPDRPALTVLKGGSAEGEISLTHRELLGAISRAANLFRSLGIRARRRNRGIPLPHTSTDFSRAPGGSGCRGGQLDQLPPE